MITLKKDVIAHLAIDQYAEKIEAIDYFQTGATMGYIHFAFTKDCPKWVRKDLLEFIQALEKVLEVTVFYEAPMNTVTRDEKFWNK